jgi:hypothetical protein
MLANGGVRVDGLVQQGAASETGGKKKVVYGKKKKQAPKAKDATDSPAEPLLATPEPEPQVVEEAVEKEDVPDAWDAEEETVYVPAAVNDDDVKVHLWVYCLFL